jgi:amidase
VQEVEIGWDKSMDEAALAWYAAMHFGRQALWLRDAHGDRMTTYALDAARAAEALTVDEMAHSWDVQHQMYQTMGQVLHDHDVFLCPTLSIGCVPALHDGSQPGFTVNGRKVDGEYGWVMTQQFNMLHNCPAMSVPSGRDRHGVPTGLQIVGRTFDDSAVFEAAMLYEAEASAQFMPTAGLPKLEG